MEKTDFWISFCILIRCDVSKRSFRTYVQQQDMQHWFFSTRNICKLSVGKQTHHFTAYWSCQRWQGEKCCHHLCHSRSRFGTGKAPTTDCCIHQQQHTQKPIKIILISRTHLYPRDSWSLPCGLEPFGPALSASPPSFPSPSGPSSFLPGLSSPLPLWPMETISISVWNLNTDFKEKVHILANEQWLLTFLSAM